MYPALSTLPRNFSLARAALLGHLAPSESQWLSNAELSLEEEREEAVQSKESCRQLEKQLASAEKEAAQSKASCRQLEKQLASAEKEKRDLRQLVSHMPWVTI